MPNTHIASPVAGGILDMISESSLVAKLVLLLLLGGSLLTWTIILTKWRALSSSVSQNGKFLNVFWTGKNIEEIFARSEQFPRSPVAAVFKNGVKELKKVTAPESTMQEGLRVDNVTRALQRASTSEVAALETNLGWLGTTASAAPFVGLFGTVWGILESFRSIGASGAANLATVGPSIAEALITTAFGILVAIPAVIAYNHFSGQIRRLAVDMECFSQDFLNIIQRSAGRKE
jgi:biopolymer transport protein TolQ